MYINACHTVSIMHTVPQPTPTPWQINISRYKDFTVYDDYKENNFRNRLLTNNHLTQTKCYFYPITKLRDNLQLSSTVDLTS